MDRGAAAEAAGDVDIAIRMYDHVTRLDPDFAEGWLAAGRMAARVEDWAYALETLNTALTLEPRRYDAYLYAGPGTGAGRGNPGRAGSLRCRAGPSIRPMRTRDRPATVSPTRSPAGPSEGHAPLALHPCRHLCSGRSGCTAGSPHDPPHRKGTPAGRPFRRHFGNPAPLSPQRAIRSARAILVLHGAASNLEEPHMALAGAFDGEHVIWLDRPGLGWSQRPRGAWSPRREAGLIAAFLDHLGIPAANRDRAFVGRGHCDAHGDRPIRHAWTGWSCWPRHCRPGSALLPPGSMPPVSGR